MKGCHSCPHKASVDAGEYRKTPWEKVPCASCDILGASGFAIEFDDERPSGDLKEAVSVTDGVEEKEPQLPLSVMRSVVTGLMTLKPELRDVVAWRYAGMTYGEIAERQGVSMACVEKRHRRALEIWPALEEMFPEKVAKRKRRKPHVKKRSPAADHSRGKSEIAPGQRKSLRGATEVLAALGFSGGLQL